MSSEDNIEYIKNSIRLLELKIEQIGITTEPYIFILRDKSIDDLKHIQKTLELEIIAFYIKKMNYYYSRSNRKMSIQPLDAISIEIQKLSLKDIELYYYHFYLDYKYSKLAYEKKIPNHKVLDSYLLDTDELENNYNKLYNETVKNNKHSIFDVDSLYSYIKNKK